LIRLIATDLDGTLLKSDATLAEDTINALRKAMALGARVVLSSGRMLESILPFANQIGTECPMIALNGAMAYDPKRGETIFSQAIPMETAKLVCRMAEQNGVFIQYYPGRGLFYAKRDPKWCDLYESRVGVRGQALGKPLSQSLSSDAMKLLSLGEGAAFQSLGAQLKAVSGVSVTYSNATYMEIMASGVNKGTALSKVAQKMHISPDEIMAFGDAENDLEMLQFAGEGYVMENARAALLGKVKNVAPANDENGVARTVEKAILAGRIGG